MVQESRLPGLSKLPIFGSDHISQFLAKKNMVMRRKAQEKLRKGTSNFGTREIVPTASLIYYLEAPNHQETAMAKNSPVSSSYLVL